MPWMINKTSLGLGLERMFNGDIRLSSIWSSQARMVEITNILTAHLALFTALAGELVVNVDSGY